VRSNKKKSTPLVEREDAKGSPGVEGFEEVGAVACVEQNARDEKAGEDEERLTPR
jgi:hypothetical protein